MGGQRIGVFAQASGFERVVFAQDPSAGLKAIVAVHSTRLGPALGGMRMRAYASEAEALTDALRLAESMTWKAAAAGLDVGGGKAVIIGDPQRMKDETLLRAYGRVVNSLGGRYITSVDVGTTTPDMDVIRRETEWVVGVSAFNDGAGDPSGFTAQGVAQGMHVCLQEVFRDPSLRGRKVAIQGAGKVGYHLAGICSSAGAEVVMADPNLDALARAVTDFGVSTCLPDEILRVDCDVLAPCALGAVINELSIARLSCRIVCGSANNQLATDEDARRLAAAGVLYAPDFIVNAGGLICVADELEGFNAERVQTRVDDIGRTLMRVFDRAAQSGHSTAEAALEYARRRIRRITMLAP